MSDPIPCAMTVGELIAELKMHDPDATVVVTPSEGGFQAEDMATFSARTGGDATGDWEQVRLPVDVAGLVQQWQALDDQEEVIEELDPYDGGTCAAALLRALAHCRLSRNR